MLGLIHSSTVQHTYTAWLWRVAMARGYTAGIIGRPDERWEWNRRKETTPQLGQRRCCRCVCGRRRASLQVGDTVHPIIILYKRYTDHHVCFLIALCFWGFSEKLKALWLFEFWLIRVRLHWEGQGYFIWIDTLQASAYWFVHKESGCWCSLVCHLKQSLFWL